MLSEGTRPKILAILKGRGQASVDQLAQDLGLASTTVRRHLDILQRDHLIDLTQNRDRIGRPQNQYYLTEEGQEAQPRSYGQLLVLLLEELSSLRPGDTDGADGDMLTKLLFSRIAERIASSPEDGQKPGGRLSRTLELLRERDFQPEVETLDNTVRITLNNCPFRLGALSDPSVCVFDQTLISRMLGVPVTQEHCIRTGDRVCCYVAPLEFQS